MNIQELRHLVTEHSRQWQNPPCKAIIPQQLTDDARACPEQFCVSTLFPASEFKRVDLKQAQKGYVSARDGKGNKGIRIFVRMGKAYDPFRDYYRAKKAYRADLTPHGRFWMLPHGNIRLAMSFWTSFGSLDYPFIYYGDYACFDLFDFWCKHRRFVAVTTLWMALDDPSELRRSWTGLYKHLTELNKAEAFPFGSMPHGNDYFTFDSPLFDCLETEGDKRFEECVRDIDDQTLRDETVSFLQTELESQNRPGWIPSWRGSRPAFESFVTPSRLWAVLWYCFVLDTQIGVGWRICPHHKKLFYPPRRDRRYCTTEEQRLYSNQRWWEEHKALELSKRREARRAKSV